MKRMFTLLLLFFVLTINTFGQEKSNPQFSGIFFGDAFYNVENKDTTKRDINGFQFRRIFFTADFSISEKFDARFRLEADQSSNSLTSGGKLGVMVKDAYLKWKNIFQGSDMIFGLSPTPAFDVVDAVWGYRSVEKTIMDLNGIVSTRDIGIDLKGKLTQDGMAKYWVKIGNNSANAPESNKYKRYYGLLQFVPANNFTITAYADYASAKSFENQYNSEMLSNGTFVFDGMINYSEKNKYSIGLESFLKSQQNAFRNSVSRSYESRSSFGLSLFGWFAVSDEIRVLGRFDTFDYNTNKDSKDDQTTFIVAGVDFKVDKNISVIPNIEVFSYQKAWYGEETKDVIARVTLSCSF